MNSTAIYIENRIIGRVQGRVFTKKISGSKHFLRRPPAICFDVDSLFQAERAGAEVCQVTDKETGHVYSASILLIRSKGFTFNRGFGNQIALPLAYWQRDDQPSRSVLKSVLKSAPQLKLFEL
jgi:hypothetical protein